MSLPGNCVFATLLLLWLLHDVWYNMFYCVSSSFLRYKLYITPLYNITVEVYMHCFIVPGFVCEPLSWVWIARQFISFFGAVIAMATPVQYGHLLIIWWLDYVIWVFVVLEFSFLYKGCKAMMRQFCKIHVPIPSTLSEVQKLSRPFKVFFVFWSWFLC